MAFLLPFLTEVATVATAIKTVAPHFFEGPAPAPVGPPPLEAPAGTIRYRLPSDTMFIGQEATLYGSGTGTPSGAASSLALTGAYGSIPRTLLNWLKKFAILYGPAVAEAVWIEFQKRRRAGQTTTLAKASIEQSYPEIHTVRIQRGRRRRMNPANIRALRRATRRIRSFKRVARKVKGLGVSHRSARPYYMPRHRRRRGDLWDVEDEADELDEAEDLGYPDAFFDEDEVEQE